MEIDLNQVTSTVMPQVQSQDQKVKNLINLWFFMFNHWRTQTKDLKEDVGIVSYMCMQVELQERVSLHALKLHWWSACLNVKLHWRNSSASQGSFNASHTSININILQTTLSRTSFILGLIQSEFEILVCSIYKDSNFLIGSYSYMYYVSYHLVWELLWFLKK